MANSSPTCRPCRTKSPSDLPNVAGERLRALTIHQHWAWLIVAGHKPCENRCWRTHYRGPLAIHAGKSHASLAASRAFCRAHCIELPADELLAFGAIVGVVDLIDVVDRKTAADRYLCGDWATGPWCWILHNPRMLAEPILCTGGQQLWTLPATLAGQLAAA